MQPTNRFDGEFAQEYRQLQLQRLRADARPGLTADQHRRMDNHRKRLTATKQNFDAAAPQPAQVPQPQQQLTSAQRRMANHRKPLTATKNPPQ